MINLNIAAIWNLISGLNKYLEKGSIKQDDISIIQPLLDHLIRLFPLPSYKCMPAQLERLTINERVPPNTNDRISKIEYIKYPRQEYVKKFGRCNVIGHPILYGGFNLMTIIKEMKPKIGINITHSEWKLKDEKPLNMFPVFFITHYKNDPHNSLSLEIKELHETYIAKLSDYEKKGFDLAMDFFAKCFAKSVDEDNHFDYFLSAYISKLILDNKTLNYDGIIYPSVQMKLGFSNMAIKPEVFDRTFSLIEVRHQLNRIEQDKNGFNYVSSRATKFDLEDGLILWED